ncbi:DUF2971 domain-containing protein [Psychroserpens mesophilus]|uniref:DUF2971 domain-containing protein n=1 Tax=Psychroserpens mesophilus TaxID=325473 RepID=UPI00058EECC4|nr:DUF2971 domain-containing protein [Psychroserpens mesophilus]
MNKPNPNHKYLTLQLKWGREDYRHLLKFNMQYPDYLKSEMFYKEVKLTEPNFLYKFFRADKYSLASLKDSYLYFSNPSGFGDEYDCLISNDDIITDITNDDENIKENLGVCCFCTVNDEDQMWDYYADGFKGFALKFKNNSKFLPYSSDIAIKSHVMYLKDNGSNNPNLIETLKSLENKHVPEVTKFWKKIVLYHHELCRKRIKYNFEKEYRVISVNANEFSREASIESKTIDSIYIGNKMETKFLNKLISILKDYKHIKIFVVTHNYEKQVLKYKRAKNISELPNIMKSRQDYS